jgi:hypothetical protein
LPAQRGEIRLTDAGVGRADSLRALDRPVQTEVNATRIFIRDPNGHLHLTKKALADGPCSLFSLLT